MTEVLPLGVAICFAHAAVQALSNRHQLDVLHVKGPAVDESLLPVRQLRSTGEGAARTVTIPRSSLDADVLVRPSHIQPLIAAMQSTGWTTKLRFEDGSPFEHAATMAHPFLPPVDLHRRFPGLGLDAEAAFDLLWQQRHEAPIAGYLCQVPSVTGQRLLLLLNAARNGRANGPETRDLWEQTTPKERCDVQQLARRTRAEVALAAATGRLEDYAQAPEHDLWARLSNGEASGLAMWVARVRAAPNRRAALGTAVRLLLPKRARLALRLGRPPTAREVAGAYMAQATRGVRELSAALRRWVRGGRP